MLFQHERKYGLGMDALVSVCSSNTNGSMVWAWMLWSPYALLTRTELWFGHGCSGHRMLFQHDRNYGLGVDALVTLCSRNTNGIMVWACFAASRSARIRAFEGFGSQAHGVRGFVGSWGSRVRRAAGVRGCRWFACSRVHGFAVFAGSRVRGFAGSRVRGFAGSRVRGFAGSRVRGFAGFAGFAGSRVRGFAGSRVRGFAGSRVRGCTGSRVRRSAGPRVRGFTRFARIPRAIMFMSALFGEEEAADGYYNTAYTYPPGTAILSVSDKISTRQGICCRQVHFLHSAGMQSGCRVSYIAGVGFPTAGTLSGINSSSQWKLRIGVSYHYTH